MTDFHFCISSLDAFADDLDMFTTAFGYPALTNPVGMIDLDTGEPIPRISNAVLMDLLRFDFDPYEGFGVSYINARMTPVDELTPSTASLALSVTLAAQIAGYFATLPTTTISPPSSLAGSDQTWHITPNGTALIDPAPQIPLQIFA